MIVPVALGMYGWQVCAVVVGGTSLSNMDSVKVVRDPSSTGGPAVMGLPSVRMQVSVSSTNESSIAWILMVTDVRPARILTWLVRRRR